MYEWSRMLNWVSFLPFAIVARKSMRASFRTQGEGQGQIRCKLSADSIERWRPDYVLCCELEDICNCITLCFPTEPVLCRSLLLGQRPGQHGECQHQFQRNNPHSTLIQRRDRRNFAGCRCITVRSLVWIVSIREEEELLVSEMLWVAVINSLWCHHLNIYDE